MGYSEYSQRCSRVLTAVLQSTHMGYSECSQGYSEYSQGTRLRPVLCLLRTELLELERLELQLVSYLRALQAEYSEYPPVSTQSTPCEYSEYPLCFSSFRSSAPCGAARAGRRHSC
jgi:hypothetical protein